MNSENGMSRERELGLRGKTLVAQLFVLFKTAQSYKEGHAAIDAPVARVLHTVRSIQIRNEEAAIEVRGGHLYLAERRLKPGVDGYEAFSYIMAKLRNHHVGVICFSPAVTEQDLGRTVYAFLEAVSVPSPDSYASILEQMQLRMVTGIELETLPDEEESIEVDTRLLGDTRIRTQLLYQQAVATAEEVTESAKAGQALRLKKAKRIVQHLVDLLGSREGELIGLTTTRCHDVYSQSHAANVCILSLAIGKRAGFSKTRLCELGLAALFHDIGKCDLPREILDKPSELTLEELELVEQHPLKGVEKFLKLKGLDPLCSRVATGVFEHHLGADNSGYPRFHYQRFSLVGRVIAIADGYDGLTSSRVSGRIPYAPEQALRCMLGQSGKTYDQALLKLFANCIGVHAIGSLLVLDSKELAVVVANNPDPARWDSPSVKLIADAAGLEVDGAILDLAHPEAGRMIVATLDPNRFRLDVSRYFR